MPTIESIRRITVQYRSEGAEKVRSDADAVATAQTRMGELLGPRQLEELLGTLERSSLGIQPKYLTKRPRRARRAQAK